MRRGWVRWPRADFLLWWCHRCGTSPRLAAPIPARSQCRETQGAKPRGRGGLERPSALRSQRVLWPGLAFGLPVQRGPRTSSRPHVWTQFSKVPLGRWTEVLPRDHTQPPQGFPTAKTACAAGSETECAAPSVKYGNCKTCSLQLQLGPSPEWKHDRESCDWQAP